MYKLFRFKKTNINMSDFINKINCLRCSKLVPKTNCCQECGDFLPKKADCPICLQYKDVTTVCCCGNNICVSCLDKCIYYKNACPICRAQIKLNTSLPITENVPRTIENVSSFAIGGNELINGYEHDQSNRINFANDELITILDELNINNPIFSNVPRMRHTASNPNIIMINPINRMMSSIVDIIIDSIT